MSTGAQISTNPLIAKIRQLFSCDLALENDFLRQENKILRSKLPTRVPLYMANCHLSSDGQFKQSVAVALPAVILKAGGLRGWAARFLPGRVAG